MENIHNTKNVVHLPKSEHQKVTGYYNRIHDFTEGKIFREWIKNESFDKQYQYGIDVLNELNLSSYIK